MPIYEYHCKSCEKEFEIIEGVHEETERKCIYCSGKARRLISQSSFVLKGTGWYLTDYARKPDQQDSADKKKTPKDNKKEDSSAKDNKTEEKVKDK